MSPWTGSSKGQGCAFGPSVSRPAVSQHLKVLSDAGLLTVQTKGTRRIYALRPQGLAELRAYLDQFWGDVMESFAHEINSQGNTGND